MRYAMIGMALMAAALLCAGCASVSCRPGARNEAAANLGVTAATGSTLGLAMAPLNILFVATCIDNERVAQPDNENLAQPERRDWESEDDDAPAL